jgi:hypothetical protein
MDSLGASTSLPALTSSMNNPISAEKATKEERETMGSQQSTAGEVQDKKSDARRKKSKKKIKIANYKQPVV